MIILKKIFLKYWNHDQNDDFHKNLRLRLEHTVDLEKKKARYHAKCMRQFNYTQSPNKVGHPMDEKISLNVQVFAHIVTQHNVKISKLLPTSKKTKTIMMPSKSFLT